MDNYYFNKIARDYHLKRTKPWKPLEIFLNHLNKEKEIFKGICADLGCASGRNFKILKNPNNKVIGIDKSLELLKIAQEALGDLDLYTKSESMNIDLILGDINKLPLRKNSIHSIFSIATIHHIEHKQQREKAIFQIFDLLIHNGYFLVTVWRKWQKNIRKQ